MTEREQEEFGWRIDRHILAVLLTLLLQTAAAVWWASAMNTRVANLEKHFESQTTQHGVKDTAQDAITADFQNRLTRMEARNEAILETVRRLERSVDRVMGLPPLPTKNAP